MADRERPESTSRRRFLAGAGAVAATAVAGCIGRSYEGRRYDSGDESLSGGITITGSSTVYPVSVAMAEEFQQEYPGVDVRVDSTGTGGGFKNHFCPGNSDVNGASRPIKDTEVEQCTGNGVEVAEFQVAGDALTVAVNEDAHWVDCMTFDDLSQIWRPDGAERWSDVRDDWPDEPFELYGPASTSGTFDWFTEHVVGDAGAHRDDYEATEDDNRVITGIEGSEYAMGYLGFAHYEENSGRVKAVEIAEEEGDDCSAPTLENAKSGAYPMARPLYIYPSVQSIRQKDQVYEFLEFYLERAETDLVGEIGYVPTNVETRDENLRKLREVAGKQ